MENINGLVGPKPGVSSTPSWWELSGEGSGVLVPGVVPRERRTAQEQSSSVGEQVGGCGSWKFAGKRTAEKG